jgi:class 3 adenylate cyclase/tetratricopeptide (TPR) repeat protein
MACSSCHSETPGAGRFCNHCGAALAAVCPSCHTQNPATAKFCGQCGSSLKGTPPPPPRARADGERRQLTVLFCDLVGSTSMSERLDPEDLREVMHSYHQASTTVIRRHDGYVAQYLGDGLLVYFGYPIAHEDAAHRAIQTGLGIVESVAQMAPAINRKLGSELSVRIGIHTGPVVVSDVGGEQRQERLALGETPNLAARLQGLAEPGTVVISETSHQLTQGFFVCKDLGRQHLKGFSTPMGVYRVLSASGATDRLNVARLTPFVGRGTEREQLKDYWKLARGGGGPVVVLSGDPGIGKSRQLLMLKAELDAAPSGLLESRCSAYHQSSSLYPLTELLERKLGFAEHPSAQHRFERLKAELEACGLAEGDALPLLATLLSLPPEGLYAPPALTPQKQRQATFEAFLAWLAGCAKQRPLLFILEDLHWADPSTLEFLALLGSRELPGVLTVLTCRPDFKQGWSKPARFSELVLERLDREGSARLAQELVGGREIPEQVLTLVLQKADGVPLFIEELLKALLSSGLLREKDHRLEVAGPLTADKVPATVQDSLMARLDRLGSAKAVVQLAATLGREFSYEMLRGISDTIVDEEELQRELERIHAAGLLFRMGHAPHETWSFKHALVQDAAYQSLLRSTRQRYHKRIAQVLAQQFPELARLQPELLAQHYAGAGMPEESAQHWFLAGQRSTAKGAYFEASNQFTRGLEQVAQLPASRERDQRELALLLGLGIALVSTRGFAAKEVEEVYSRAQELCLKDGDTPVAVVNGLFSLLLVRSDREALERLAPLMRQQLEVSQDLSTRLVCHAALQAQAFWVGELQRSLWHGVQGLKLLEGKDVAQEILSLMASHSVESVLYLHLYSPWADALQGNVDRALEGLEKAIQLTESMGHPYVLATALMFGAAIWSTIGDLEKGREYASRALALAMEHGFPFVLANASCWYGLALAKAGNAEAVAHLERGTHLHDVMGANVVNASFKGVKAEAHLTLGEFQQAMEAVQQGLALCGGNKLARIPLADLHRLQGEVLLRQGDETGAEAALRKSLTSAQEFQARVYELRTALVLGQLLRRQGKREEALAVVAASWNGFPPTSRLAEFEAARAFLADPS